MNFAENGRPTLKLLAFQSEKNMETGKIIYDVIKENFSELHKYITLHIKSNK